MHETKKTITSNECQAWDLLMSQQILFTQFGKHLIKTNIDVFNWLFQDIN